jgi:hypothetical protein
VTLPDRKADYIKSIPAKLAKQITTENRSLNQSIDKLKYRGAVRNVIADYIEKFNFVKVET